MVEILLLIQPFKIKEIKILLWCQMKKQINKIAVRKTKAKR